MAIRVFDRARWDAMRSVAIVQGARFRRGRFFIPVVVTVPLLALSGGVGGYAAWDSTRVNIPNVVGALWPEAIATLQGLGLGVDEGEASDETIKQTCYVVSAQGLESGTRVVPDDTVVTLEVEPDQRRVPDVVGVSVAEAREALEKNCFHEEILPTWCVPTDFSGGEAALSMDALAEETGFTYEPTTGRLKDTDRTPNEDWIVCDQSQRASTMYGASSTVGLGITVPLTTVPAPVGSELGQTLKALENSADGCKLNFLVAATFTPDPTAIRGKALPPLKETSTWRVRGLEPAIGHAALCGSTVNVDVEWPSTSMPQLVGLHHVPETPLTATPATAALEAAHLQTACSGRGTVTSQVPAAGAPAPVGIAVTCVAELLVPNIVGLDQATANAVLAAAGLSGSGTGSGVVVSQSLTAGTIATATQSVSHYSEQPRVYTPSSYYENCTAARAAGAAPLYRGDAGYRAGLDRDGDGIACE